ncbi:MAG: Wzz/FepE/Etk N-terminal domain-containing protein, partial [Acidobacteria bacterium]|nr:Wzz/FepE/Etk N-terminal domain-containing protein [Acidobacteriota bacterium]
AILRRRRGLILLTALLCGLTAGAVSLLQSKIYSATTHLLVSESKISDPRSRQTNYVYYELLRSYEAFINNDYLIQKTVEQFQLHRPPYELTPYKFKNRRILEVKLSKNTRLLEVTVEFPDARLAAEIANYFADNAVNFNEELNARDTQRTREFLKQQLDEARRSMERSGQMLLEFSRASRLEELRESVWNLLEEKSENESRLARLGTELSRTAAERSSLSEELKNQEPKIELKRSLAENPVFRESVKEASSQSGGLPPTALMKEEAVNPVYQQVQSGLVEANSELLSLKAGIQSLEKATESTRRKLALLLREKASKESTLERLTREYELASEGWAALNRKYQDASINVSARSTDLKVIAPAIVPERPVKPRVPLNVLLAVALGLALSSSLVLVRDRWERSKVQMQAEIESGTEERIKEIKRRAKGFS